MALAKVIKFKDQLLQLGDGASPTEAFAAPCGFTSLNMTVNIETNSNNVPDCDDPDLPSWLVSDEVSKQMQVGGSGVMDRDAMIIWRDWMQDGGEKTVRWVTTGTAAQGGGYFMAPALLTSYEETGEKGNLWQTSVTLTLNGKPTWVPAT